MKYEIGRIVVLINEKTVYITNYDNKTKRYKGFDVDNSNSQDEIVFSENEVVMTV